MHSTGDCFFYAFCFFWISLLFQNVLPCLLEDLPLFNLRGLCYNGVGIDEEFVLTMDEESGQTVFFGKTYSTIRFNIKHKGGVEEKPINKLGLS